MPRCRNSSEVGASSPSTTFPSMSTTLVSSGLRSARTAPVGVTITWSSTRALTFPAVAWTRPSLASRRQASATASRAASIEGSLFVVQRRLRRRHPGYRHAVGRAAHVVEPGELEEADRLRSPAVLAADPELQIRLGLASDPGSQPDEPADSGLVDRLERAPLDDL